MERWCNKVALVTGASSGIGANIAKKLVENGLNVIGIARRLDKLHLNAEQWNNQNDKGKFYPLQCDLTKTQEILKVFKFIKDKFGTINILINNAGISKPLTLIDGSIEDFQNIYQVNVMASLICTKQALMLMKETHENDGHIIFINSIMGHSVLNVPLTNVYTASKFSITALAETFRLELYHTGNKIKITSLSPGLVDTEMIKTEFKNNDEIKKILSKTTYLDVNDIGNAIIYCLGTPQTVQISELIIRPNGSLY